MRRNSFFAFTLLLLLCGSAAISATKAKPAAKPKPKTATVALAGDNGVFGTVYSIRKSYPLYFRLKSAEYTTDQMIIGDRLYVPNADQKLLVLHFTVQNPLKSEQSILWESLKFTAVDAMNVNHEMETDWGDEINKGRVDISLKPAQKLDIFTGIMVPAKGIVPKLMVMPADENDGPILRYDLKNPKNIVASLKKFVADPSDSSGCTALETVTGELNNAYPYANFDITVQKFDYSDEHLDANADEDSSARYFAATLLVKNNSPENIRLFWDAIVPVLVSTDGEEMRYVDMLLASANRGVDKDLKTGEEAVVRLCFELPEGATPGTLSVKEGESRTYEFKCSR